MTAYRELTVLTVIVGICQGIILNIAFVYIALKLGFSLGGSAIAAMLGYVILRGIFRRGTIVENNLNQTIASSINNAGTGVAFVLPAVFLLYDQHILTHLPLIPLLFAGISGAILGLILIIPLRKQLIEIERLHYPTGVAVATVLQSGATGFAKARWLGAGAALGGVSKVLLLTGGLEQFDFINGEDLDISFGFLPAYFGLGVYLSPLVFAAGLLAGRSGLPFFVVGLVAWCVLSPMTVAVGWIPPQFSQTDTSQLNFIYSELLKPLGIGTLIGAALIEMLFSFTVLRGVIKLISHASQAKRDSSTQAEELPRRVLLQASLVAAICFLTAVWLMPDINLTQTLLISVIGIVWLFIASLIVAQCMGHTDISPLSGMALVSVTLMLLFVDGSVSAAVLLAMVVTVAISQAADMMQDLKTGFLVGSRPLLQQSVQLSVSWIGIVVAFGVVWVLWQSSGFGSDTSLPAPQATTLVGIIDAMQTQDANLDKFLLGGLIGLVLGAVPISGLGVLSGLALYLPFSITFTYGLGVFAHIWAEQRYGLDLIEQRLVPLAAGLIIGEALVGVGDALRQVG